MGNTFRLDFNQEHDAWEQSVFYDATGSAYAWDAACVYDVASDINRLVQVDEAGGVYQMEKGSQDNGAPIRLNLLSKRYLLEQICLIHEVFIRLQAVDDTFTLTVTVGGSEYGNVSHSYTFSGSGTGDVERKIRTHRDLLGRWMQIGITSNTNNLPAIREITAWFLPHRNARVSLPS